MDSSGKKILYINLEKKMFDAKTSPDLNKFIGGVGLGIKLLELHKDLNPIIFSIGPLNGFFPFASKTAIILKSNNKVEDIYLGGSLSTRMKFSDLDAIVIYGKSKVPIFLDIENDKVLIKSDDTDVHSTESKIDALLPFRDAKSSETFQNVGLPGKRSILKFAGEKLKLDEYFETPGTLLEEAFAEKNLIGLCTTGTKLFEPKDMEKYTLLYNLFLDKTNELTIAKGFFPSCSGCPMGCEKSKIGEVGGNILVHSLVACTFAQNIYNDVSTVFSALNVLGYQYTHEDIENLQSLVQDSLNNI